MIQEMRNYKAEQERLTVEEMLNNSLQEMEWEEDGSDDTPKSEELLQLPSDKDSESTGRRYDRLLGWLYIGDADISLNEQMITEGYAWAYDGGTKQKNFEELREIRRSFGTLAES